MKYANLGATGTRVSRICLGCMTYQSVARCDRANCGCPQDAAPG